MKVNEAKVDLGVLDTKVILVDCDDVMIHFCEAWIDWLNKDFNTKHTINDIKEWDISVLFPNINKDLLYKPLTKEAFWKKVKPRLDAIKYLNLLSNEGYEIYVVTATDYRNLKYKIDFILKKYFPFIPLDNIIVCNKKQLLVGDFLIDDNPNNLIGGNYRKVLFDAPHNRSFTNSSVSRVNDWHECYDFIHSFS